VTLRGVVVRARKKKDEGGTRWPSVKRSARTGVGPVTRTKQSNFDFARASSCHHTADTGFHGLVGCGADWGGNVEVSPPSFAMNGCCGLRYDYRVGGKTEERRPARPLSIAREL
jgi:hypothetical protein